MRKLLDGTEVADELEADKLEVYTKCPTKYKLVDMETGEEYEGHHPNNTDGFSWKKINA